MGVKLNLPPTTLLRRCCQGRRNNGASRRKENEIRVKAKGGNHSFVKERRKKIGIVGRMKGKNVGFRVLGERYKEGGSRDEGGEKDMCATEV